MKSLRNLGNKITGDWYEVIVIGLLAVILYFVIKCKKVENLTKQVEADVKNAQTASVADAVQQRRQAVADAAKSAAIAAAAEAEGATMQARVAEKVEEVQQNAGQITAFANAPGVGVGRSNLRPDSRQEVVDGPNETADRVQGLQQKFAGVPTPQYKQVKSHNYSVGYPCDRN